MRQKVVIAMKMHAADNQPTLPARLDLEKVRKRALQCGGGSISGGKSKIANEDGG
jgi:hypothetical protein